jgi:hypothetical protein
MEINQAVKILVFSTIVINVLITMFFVGDFVVSPQPSFEQLTDSH